MSDRLLLLVGACAILSSLESMVPLYRYRGSRFRHALPNVALTLIVLLMNTALAFLSARVSGLVVSNGIGLLFLAHLPQWVRIVAGIAALDLFAWLAHVGMHKSTWGWRFHRVHHSEDEVDVTTAFRQHPGETMWRILWQLLAIVAFGIPFWVVAVYLSISALNAQFEHANVRVPETIDRFVRLLFVTPGMHKVHHSREQKETDSNYANIFSLWDRLFGTYTRKVDFAALRYGLDGLDERTTRSVRGLLTMPF